jgi:hypothetical protein
MLGATALQEGAIGAGSYDVSAGSNLTCSIAASTGEGAVVQGDSITPQGLYYVAPHTAAIVETHTAAHATLPRIDQIVLEVLDASHDGGASNTARVRIVDGVATSGATLDNRNGAAALPATAMRLADVLIPAAAVTMLAANVRDRRTMARGAYRLLLRNANAAAGNDYITSSVVAVVVDSTNLAPRIECSGVPIRMNLVGQTGSSVSGDTVAISMRMDSVAINGGAIGNIGVISSGFGYDTNKTWPFVPTAGSHVLAPWYYRAAGTGNATLYARAAIPLVFEVKETVRPNADNA